MTTLPNNRANTLKAAFRACDVSPLVGTDSQRYYVDLSGVRNTEAVQGINTRLNKQVDHIIRLAPVCSS